MSAGTLTHCLPQTTREMDAALAWLSEAAAHADESELLALLDRLVELAAELRERLGSQRGGSAC